MLNYFVIILLSTTVLITHNIILLNEETLILVCFITFIWLSLRNLSASVQENLNGRVHGIKVGLEKSLENSVFNLQSLLNTQVRFWNLLKDFKNLGQNCQKFANLVTDLIVVNSAKSITELFPQKLQFTERLESQTAKLLAKLVILKLKKAIKLKNFYSSTMGNPHFVCSNKIVIRECVQKVNPSN